LALARVGTSSGVAQDKAGLGWVLLDWEQALGTTKKGIAAVDLLQMQRSAIFEQSMIVIRTKVR